MGCSFVIPRLVADVQPESCLSGIFSFISPCGLMCPISSVIRNIDNQKTRGGGLSDGVTVPGSENLPALPSVIAGAHTPQGVSRKATFRFTHSLRELRHLIKRSGAGTRLIKS